MTELVVRASTNTTQTSSTAAAPKRFATPAPPAPCLLLPLSRCSHAPPGPPALPAAYECVAWAGVRGDFSTSRSAPGGRASVGEPGRSTGIQMLRSGGPGERPELGQLGGGDVSSCDLVVMRGKWAAAAGLKGGELGLEGWVGLSTDEARAGEEGGQLAMGQGEGQQAALLLPPPPCPRAY